jgi:elongation factor 2
MVNIELVQALMKKQNNIRNMSIIAHVDHGKTTLTDSLISVAGYVRKEDIGSASIDKTMKQQAERGITIKSTGVSLNWRYPEAFSLPQDAEGRDFLVNLIDSPGHVDFSSEVTAALRLTDGALVVIDCVEGVAVQTETVLRQALAERIRPVLTINKLDRAFIELQLPPEEMYQAFCRSIESANVILAEVGDDGPMGHLEFSPLNGNVAFSAGLQGWAFTLSTFARIYTKKLGLSYETCLRNFWGDRFYDPDAKKFINTRVSPTGKELQRSFCEFILQPISRVFSVCLERNTERLKPLCERLGIRYDPAWLDLATPKLLLKNVISEWLPASEALLEMVVTHLPSPVQAQAYRAEILYDGPLDDETAEAIRRCDPNGPTVMYIAKMVPNADYTRFFAFGRVFSGTVKPGQHVHVLQAGSDKSPVCRIQNTLSMLGKKMESVEFVPCGNTCAVAGVDKFLTKNGTLAESAGSKPIRSMKYSVSPVMRLAVAPANAADLPRFVEGLKRLAQFDPLLQVITTKDGHILAGAGELHLEVCLETLRADILGAAVPIKVSEPIVEYRETITGRSEKILSKSKNKHNRLWVGCEATGLDFATALESGSISTDPKEFPRILHDNYGWDAAHTRKIWTLAPEVSPVNVLVEAASGVQYLHEGKDSICQGFSQAVFLGPLAEEPVRGIKVWIEDAQLHPDNAHRGPAQLVPMASRCVKGAILSAQPALLEPIYSVEIQCPPEVLSGIYTVINKRRGTLVQEALHPTLPLRLVTIYLPVAESFGFSQHLREATGGQAFPSASFSHWAEVPGSPYQPGTQCHKVVKAIRARKGLPEELPLPDAFIDKL